MSMVVVGGLIISAVFWYLNRTVSQHSARSAALVSPIIAPVLLLSAAYTSRARLWYRNAALKPWPAGFPGPALPCPGVQVVPRVQGSIPKRDKKKKKEPMGVGESFAFLAKNPYIRDLAFLVRSAAAYVLVGVSGAQQHVWLMTGLCVCAVCAGHPCNECSHSVLMLACIPLMVLLHHRWWPTAFPSTWWR